MVELKRGPAKELIAENDVIDARLSNVEAHEFTHEGKLIQKLRWYFTVTDPDNDWFGADIQGETSQSFNPHPSCKAYHWVKALTGKAYGEDEPLSTDSLIGLPCRIMIYHKPGKENTVWMRVKDVIPPGRASRTVTDQAVENPF